MSLRAGRAVLGHTTSYVNMESHGFATAQTGCPHARAGERCNLRSKLFDDRIFPVVRPALGMCTPCRQAYRSSIAAGWAIVGGTVLCMAGLIALK